MSTLDKSMNSDPLAGNILVFTEESARRIPLPGPAGIFLRVAANGKTEIEADAPSDWALSISSDEGSIIVAPGGAGETPTLNNHPLEGRREVRSGDAVTVGDAELVFTFDDDRQPRDALGPREFELRMEVEVERSLRYSRPLVIAVIDLAGPPADDDVVRAVATTLRRVDVVGRMEDGSLGIILPETDEQADIPIRRALDSAVLLRASAKAAFASCPCDGTSARSLLSGARRAADSAYRGSVASLSAETQPLRAGDMEIVAADPKMIRLFSLVKDLARSSMPILIFGETGVGKEIVAEALHAWSPRTAGPLVSFNCAAVSETLLEAELFGYERGAFTGADAPKAGLFEAAHGGTLFLDEIGEASLRAQAELLRSLESGKIRRVGATAEIPVDVRIVAATNRDLNAEMKTGGFRADLYYRLGAASVEVPPLSERPLDIPQLARRFLDQARARMGRNAMTLDRAAIQRLSLHQWPGNVREIRNLMEFLAATVAGDVVSSEDLPEHVASNAAPWLTRPSSSIPGTSPAPGGRDRLPEGFSSLAEEISRLERLRMEQALCQAEGVRNRAAALIGMPLRTFVSKLKKYDLDKIPSPRNRGKKH